MVAWKSWTQAALIFPVLGTCLKPLKSGSYREIDDTTVDLGYVKYRGYTNETAGLKYFRGIPYAANPTGALRWQKPQPIELRNDFQEDTVYSATESGPACYQLSIEEGMDQQSEDCLILDIIAPLRPASSALPVVVSIHGGGFLFGGIGGAPVDAMVNATDGNLIYVSMQYRLGILGFLGGSAIREDGVMNAGMLDQRLALQWVQRHIHKFGGDPNRVTLTGGSAGGSAVSFHLIAYGAEEAPLFSAALIDYAAWPNLPTPTQQEEAYRYVLEQSNCSSLACLRSLSTDEIDRLSKGVSEVTTWFNTSPGALNIWPATDKTFLRDLPSVEWDLGHLHDVPILINHNQYEGTLFTNGSLTDQSEATKDTKALFPHTGPSFYSRLYQLYPKTDYNSSFFQRSSWFGDFAFNCPTYEMGSNAINHNSNSSAVFKLIFDAGSQDHGAITNFTASNETMYWNTANNQTLARIITSYWNSFIITHDPNILRASDAPFWPSYKSGGRSSVEDGESVGFEILQVNYTNIGAMPDPDVSPKCDFWSSRRFSLFN